MNTNEQIANLIEQLNDEISMMRAVQSSAYVTLARHLALQGLLDLDSLANDIDTLGNAQPDEGWQSGHAALAGALRLINGLPSMQR